jgi:two-component system, cell cycle sensor histidine kinase and response regulator CckA
MVTDDVVMRQILQPAEGTSAPLVGRAARIIELQQKLSSAERELGVVAAAVAEAAADLTAADGVVVGLREAAGCVVWGVAGSAVSLGGVDLAVGRVLPAALLDDSAAEAEDAVVCVIVRTGSTTVGALLAGSSIGEHLSEPDRETLELLAVVLGAAVGRAAELEARQAAAEAIERFETIFELAPIGIGLMTPDGRFALASPAMCAITGYSVEELARLPISEYAPPDTFKQIAEPFRAMFAGDHDSFQSEHRLRTREGGIVWVDASLSLLRDTDDKPQFAIVMAQDITRRRLAEERVRETEKIEAVGQLAAGVAHDFNNLLTAMLGYAALARMQVAEDGVAADHLARIEESAKRAAALTQQLLAFGRKQTLNVTRVDLNELISDAVTMVRSLLGPTIAINCDLDPDAMIVEADPTQLQHVLLNLALNARDAMSNGGTLTIGTRHLKPDAEQESRRAAGGSQLRVLLWLADTGCGMEDDVCSRIFEPFFTTKAVGKGTGLGLSSAYGIVKQSEGEIEVESELGVGTTFRIYLPALENPKPAVAQDTLEVEPDRAPEPNNQNARRNRYRVLLVEDQPEVRKLITLLLTESGHRVTDVPDGESALALTADGDHFDIVITDIVLPGIDGVTVAAQLHTHRPDLPILFISGYQREHRVDPARLLRKPFTTRELLDKLDNIVAALPG